MIEQNKSIINDQPHKQPIAISRFTVSENSFRYYLKANNHATISDSRINQSFLHRRVRKFRIKQIKKKRKLLFLLLIHPDLPAQLPFNFLFRSTTPNIPRRSHPQWGNYWGVKLGNYENSCIALSNRREHADAIVK